MEVGWHLRFSREDELVFLVPARLAPNVEDAVFIAGDWTLAWEPGPAEENSDPERLGHRAARVSRIQPRGVGHA